MLSKHFRVQAHASGGTPPRKQLDDFRATGQLLVEMVLLRSAFIISKTAAAEAALAKHSVNLSAKTVVARFTSDSFCQHAERLDRKAPAESCDKIRSTFPPSVQKKYLHSKRP